jgi:energy-coupling factor transporter ATP-binding protein EcfA2
MTDDRKVTPIRSRMREAPRARRQDTHLPEDCPVTPLGVEGDLCWYIDGVGQLVAIPRKGHSKLAIHGLFSPHTHYCQDARPDWAKTIRLKDDGQGEREVVVDFRPDVVARDLMAACAAMGPFNPVGRVRGRGIWRGEDDDLVPHHGTAIQIKNQALKPGRHGAFVYPRGPERPLPASDPQPGGAEGAAARVLADLSCWQWSRPGLDQQLLLGWICATFYAGALDWRPHGWVNGPRAAGKSTLFRYLSRLLHEPSGCIMTGNTTAAGVRSVLKDDALAVLFDDAEAGETPDRIRNLVELMRAASSGSLVLRGTAEHTSASFTVRFMGLVNSILRPPLTAQDLSRMMLLNLEPLGDDAREPGMGRSDLELVGRQLFRRMLDAWPRFLVEFPRWKAALKQAGMPGRAPEQFGILLACQDVALHDSPADSDTMAELAVKVAEGTASDRAEELPEWARCLERVTSTIVPAFAGGQQRTLGTLIGMVALQSTWKNTETGHEDVWPATDRDNAARALAAYGLRVVFQHAPPSKIPLRRWRQDVGREASTMGDGRAVGWLAVANSHAGLNDAVFRRSHYAAASGTSGGWKAALETAPGCERGREMRFGGPASRCVLVPLDLVLDGGGSYGEAVE